MLKKTIRQIALNRRRILSQNKLSDMSIEIKNVLFDNFNFNNYCNVHLFLSINNEKNNEINTNYIIDELRNNYKNINIIVPKVNFNNNTLDHFYLYENTKLIKNKYDVPEPDFSNIYRIDHEKYKNNNLDMVIVPTNGLSKEGDRVGYGGGYYDKFLAELDSTIKVGLCLDGFVSIIDVNETDIKMDYGILPDKTNKFYLQKF